VIGIYSEIVSYLEQGGWIMIPLIISSFVMWFLIVDRLQAFRALTHGDITIHQAVGAVRGEDVAIHGNGLRATIIRSFLEERSGIADLDKEIMRQCVMHEEQGLSKRLSTIAVLASIAPLLGLLGTVLGMIETFNVISLFGTGNAKAMASGISVALITTQTGLLVAIPGLFISGMLKRQSVQLKTRLIEDATILRRTIGQLEKAKGGN
jgi:biopolymer transport protein ExbB